MAILTDIFVCAPEDATKYESLLKTGKLSNLFEVVQFKGLTNLEFGTLWAIIEGKQFDFDKHGLASLSPQAETWLFRFPPKLVQALAALSSPAVETIAESWAKTEELHWDPPEAREVVEELVRLANLALSASKGLYFWGSL
jgi:hypothetical protein